MKLSISNRLLCCASLVPQGTRVADVGTDHGYLGIYLLQRQLASFVVASDLREQPLEKAKTNAALFGTAEQMAFVLSDGLQQLDPDKVDTIVCAGMGGDLVTGILDSCDWVKDDRYTLILQPQSAGQDLRRWMGAHNFYIIEETLARDGGFLYTVMRAKYGKPMVLSPGEQYASPQLQQSRSPLLPTYLRRIESALEKTVAGIRQATQTPPERLRYYETALAEVKEMRKRYDTGSGCGEGAV